jgi:predicted DNA-binding protein
MDNARAVEVLRQVYPEMRRKLDALRSTLDPATEPVKTVLLDAYIERLEEFYLAGEKGADEQRAVELRELSPWILDSGEISARAALGGPLYPMMLHSGYSPSETYDTLERERKAPKGRQPEAEIAIEALEMHLAGKSYAQITKVLRPDGMVSPDAIRKLVNTLEPVYEKYKPRK